MQHRNLHFAVGRVACNAVQRKLSAVTPQANLSAWIITLQAKQHTTGSEDAHSLRTHRVRKKPRIMVDGRDSHCQLRNLSTRLMHLEEALTSLRKKLPAPLWHLLLLCSSPYTVRMHGFL